ncbi:MAG: hypothetical protein R2788_01890 [Saprospiraceae bacterium]
MTVEDNEAPVLGYTDEVCYAEYEVCLEEQAAYTAEQLAELEIFIANCNGDPACLQEAAYIAASIDEGSCKYMAICLFILNGCDVIQPANNPLPNIVVEAPVGSCEIELNPVLVVMENCATLPSPMITTATVRERELTRSVPPSSLGRPLTSTATPVPFPAVSP